MGKRVQEFRHKLKIISSLGKTCLLLFFGFLVFGCSKETDSQKPMAAVESIQGIMSPESAAAVSDGRIFISEIGEPGKDGDGKIVQVSIDGTKKIIADSGLNDPKGLIVIEDEIYVTDNNEVKKVSMDGNVVVWIPTGDFPKKPQFLNDIAKSDEVIYISDSGDLLNSKGGGRIFKVDSDKKVTVLVDKSNSKLIRSPNGLSTHQDGYLMFNDFENGFLFKVNLTNKKVEKLGEGYGGADGLVMADNNLYLSDWKNGKVFKLDLSKEGSSPVVIRDGMKGSADIDVTSDGKYLIIPEMKANRVVIHSLD